MNSGRAQGVRFVGVALVQVLLATGCSLLVDPEIGTINMTDEPWFCLGSIVAPAPATSPTVEATFRFFDLGTQEPPADLQVSFYSNIDVDLDNPLGTVSSLDETGAITAELARGFEGFALVESAALERAIIHLPELDRDTVFPTLQMIPVGQIQALAAGIGLPLDPSRVVAIVSVLDCFLQPAPGASVTTDGIDQFTAVLYLEDNLPTASQETTSNGNAVVVNHRTGQVNVRSQVAVDGRSIDNRAATLTLGFLHYFPLSATPFPTP